jgi:cation:H+ antiporter
MLAVNLMSVLVFSFGLMKATEILVGALRRLAEKTGWDKFGLTALIIALSTSLPELLVGVTAALEGNPTLSLGNVLGSNIANVSLVIGGAALIGGSVGVAGEFLKKDFFTAFLVGALPLLLLLDGKLSRIESLVLVVVYGIFNWVVLGRRRVYSKTRQPVFVRILRRLRDGETDRDIVWLVGGAGLLMVSAEMLVRTAVSLAVGLQVPLFLVGMLVVSVGTVLPELSFEIEAIRKREAGMVFGNLLGTIVTNATLVLGVVGLISPISLPAGIRAYLIATIAFVMVFGVFWLLVRTKKRLDRWEGAVLILIYLVFAYWELVRAGGK